MKSNKIKLLFFITLSVLLIGIVCAGDVDTNVQPDTVSDDLTDATESVSVDAGESASVVADDVTNDNKIVKNTNIIEQTVKTDSKKIKTSISIEPVKDTDTKKYFTLKARVTDENNTGVGNANVTVSYYGIKFNFTTDYLGNLRQTFSPEIPGRNTISVYFDGNDTFESSSAKTSFNVTGTGQTNIYLDSKLEGVIGETMTFHGRYMLNTYPIPITQTNIRLNINGVTYLAKTDDDGYFSHDYVPTKLGKFWVYYSYPGNSRFGAVGGGSIYQVVNAEPLDTYITLDDVSDVAYGENVKISGHYYYANDTPLTYTRMRFKINGNVYLNATDENGYFSYTYKPENVFKNTVTVYYPGNRNFNAAKNTSSYYVNITSPIDSYIKTIFIADVNNGEYAKIRGYYYYANSIPLTYTNMRIKINGNLYTAKTDREGYFSFKYKTNQNGVNGVKVYYPGNPNFKAASVETTFFVYGDGPQSTYIMLNDIPDVAYGESTNISGYYLYANDIPLTYTPMKIIVNDRVFTTKTDDNGYFNLNYVTQKVYKNWVNVSYGGNSKFEGATASKSFNVKIEQPINTYIKLDAIKEVKVGQTTRISGYYCYGDDLPLSDASMFMHFNNDRWGVNPVTDNKGYFYYDYKTQKSGKNKVTVSYPGNDNFNSAMEQVYFNVLG